MAKFNFKITDYSIHLGERDPMTIPLEGADDAKITITAVITCRGEGGEMIKVNFYREKECTNPAFCSTYTIMEDGKPSGTLWEPETNFPNFIDLLRNESPIWALIEEGKKSAEVRLYTGRWEPVGVGDEDYVAGVKQKT